VYCKSSAKLGQRSSHWDTPRFGCRMPRRAARPFCFQGLSHAEPTKDNPSLQTRHATCLPPKAVDAECRPRQVGRFRKRATKLRAISRTCPRRSAVGERRRGGELLPTRRTLLQIDVARPRPDIVDAHAPWDLSSQIGPPADCLQPHDFLHSFMGSAQGRCSTVARSVPSLLLHEPWGPGP